MKPTVLRYLKKIVSKVLAYFSRPWLIESIYKYFQMKVGGVLASSSHDDCLHVLHSNITAHKHAAPEVVSPEICVLAI